MKQQTAVEAKKQIQGNTLLARGILQRPAIRPIADHATPSPPSHTSMGVSFNPDFSRVPVRSPTAPMMIQPKLTIGRPGDKYEQEADRVAESVMRIPNPAIQLKPT